MNPQNRISATYYRGGTSRGLMFARSSLPTNQSDWGPIFADALGSPDPNGRQLDGLGTGLSSLSKVCVVGPSQRSGMDVDYTFVQVGVRDGVVDYSSNCGNMSSAVGPFAVEEGMMGEGADGRVEVRIWNTNTGKMIKAAFEVEGGEAVVHGDLKIAGVAGTGARIELAFVEPGGSRTGMVLPTERVVDEFEEEGGERVRASCVDVANPCVFVNAESFGVEGKVLPDEAEARPSLLKRLEGVRRKAGLAMGLAENENGVPESVPKIIMVSRSKSYRSISGETIGEQQCDLVVRSVSGTSFHRAVQITGALATAVACKLEGSVANEVVAKKKVNESGITLGHPSGTIMVTAKFDEGTVKEASVFRTARRLMQGQVFWKG